MEETARDEFDEPEADDGYVEFVEDEPDSEPDAPGPQDAPARTARFVHLHNHTEFSWLDGMGRIGDMIAAAKADGQTAIAITDHGTLGGCWKFAAAARAAGIKPILGIEAYIAVHGSGREEEVFLSVPADEESGDDDEANKPTIGLAGETRTKKRRYEHLTVLAATKSGWLNLVKMHNEAHATGFWGKPRIDHLLLRDHRDGLIVMTGCIGGPIAGPLSRGDEESARENLRWLCEDVGPENVYVEVMDHGIPAQYDVAPKIQALVDWANGDEGARRWSHGALKLVATNDAHYTCGDDAEAHEAWLAVGTKARLSDANRFKFHGGGHHVRTEDEMRSLFGGQQWWLRACDTTVEIAARIEDDVLPEHRLHLPVFDVARVAPLLEPDWRPPAGVDPSDTSAMSKAYLRHLMSVGIRQRLGLAPDQKLTRDVNARLASEFKTICNLGVADYFLIMRDVIEWCRSDRGLPNDEHPLGEPGQKVPIRTGPGRGSAAGSLVSFALGIVRPNPLTNGLLFERFLDPERVGMPDIDTDFEQGRRQEVIAYLVARWGEDRVANIGSFGVCRTRAALRDAARVLELPQVGDALAPKVPIDSGKPAQFAELLDPANGATADFRAALAEQGEAGQRVVNLARRFENVTKTPSIHASGIIVSDVELRSLVPLRKNHSKQASADSPWITEWDGVDCDKFGLLKLDILGLRNLDVVSEAVRFIEERTGEHVEPDDLDPDDGSERSKKAWALLREGRTASVFQMESPGMTELAMDAGPECLDDLSAIVALYRPGPLGQGMHHHWAARKRGTEAVDYSIFTTDETERAALGSVLDESMGIPIFQEQSMRLGEAVAGFGAVEKNRLRKAISKKNQAEIDLIGEMWMAGAVREICAADGSLIKPAFSSKSASAVWDAIKESGRYQFNKSHSTAYGMLAYETAYLKANWPLEYAAAVLATTRDKADKRLAAIESLRQDGIALLAPDINASHVGTFPTDDGVLLGLSEIRGVGSNAAAIVREREADGRFASVGQMVSRVRVIKADKEATLAVNIVEALIEAGACDEFGPRMGQMAVARALSKHPDTVPLAIEWGLLDRARRQRARLGVTLGTHPMRALAGQLATARGPDGKQILGVHRIAQAKPDERVSVAGVLVGWAEKAYGARRGRPGRLARVAVEGSKGSVVGVMFDGARSQLGFVPVVGQVVGIRGRVQVKVREVEDSNGRVREVEEREMLIDSLWLIPVHDPVEDKVRPAGPVPDTAGWPVTPEPVPIWKARDLAGVVALGGHVKAEHQQLMVEAARAGAPWLDPHGGRGVWLLTGPARPVVVRVGLGPDLDEQAGHLQRWVEESSVGRSPQVGWESAASVLDGQELDAAHAA